MRAQLSWIVAGILIAAFLFFGNSVEAVANIKTPDFNRWDHLFKKYGGFYRVPWRWLKAIAIVESSLGRDPRVMRGLNNPMDIEGSKSTDGKSWGLMQITLATAKGLEKRTVQVFELNNPDFSVNLSAKLVRELIGRFSIQDRESVIRAYNGGPAFGALTVPYYTKFVAALKVVEAGNPGGELEFN